MTKDFKDVIDGLTKAIEEKLEAKSEKVEELQKRFDALDAEKEDGYIRVKAVLE